MWTAAAASVSVWRAAAETAGTGRLGGCPTPRSLGRGRLEAGGTEPAEDAGGGDSSRPTDMRDSERATLPRADRDGGEPQEARNSKEHPCGCGSILVDAGDDLRNFAVVRRVDE